jgi:biotin synthase
MGAAWREPKDRDLDKVCEMVEGVRALGLETCATLGMLTPEQATGSRHPVSTITTTTSTPRRSSTARSSPRAPIESASTRSTPCATPASTSAAAASSAWARADDRVGMIATLASLPVHPESVPINMLVRVEGTPLAGPSRARSARLRAHHRGRAHRHAASVVRLSRPAART